MSEVQKPYEFSKLVFKTAWSDTVSYFGWNKRTVVLGILWVIGGGLYYFYAGEAALWDELVQIAVWGFAPVGVFAFLLFLWNVSIAPFKLIYEKAGRSSVPPPATSTKKKPTQSEQYISMAKTVFWLRGELEEARRWVGLMVDSDIPPKIDSVFISLRKIGLETPSISRAEKKEDYFHYHLEYLKNIHPYMQVGQVKEAKSQAKVVVGEIKDLLKKAKPKK